MDWKSKLGIEQEEIEEEQSFIFTNEIDQYFLDLGFYESTMNPRFFGGDYDGSYTADAPVLRYDGDWDWDGHGVQRVFMNKNEIYIERQTSYRSYDGSSYYKFEQEPTTVEEIEGVLQELVEIYERYVPGYFPE